MIDKEVMQMPGWRGGDGDAAYLDKTLRYQDVELSLDESVGWKVMAQLLARAFVASFLLWCVFAFLAVLVLGVSGEPGAGFGILMFGGIVSSLAFWVILLFSKLPEPIAEWRVLLADRKDTADSVYSQIAGTLNRRRLPLGASYRRIRTGLGPQHVSNRLVLSHDKYTAYVSVFGYGTSLYLGWVMWRTRRGATLIKQFVMDVIGAMFGWNDPERLMMRTELPRAMREALHSACREGLFVAVEGVTVPGQYGFPQGMPTVEGESAGHAAPMPQAPQFTSPVPASPGGPQVPVRPEPARSNWDAGNNPRNWNADNNPRNPQQ